MDFSKLNVEFFNIQQKLEKYDKQLGIVLAEIKQLEKEINKLETKIKQTKSNTEKCQYKLVLEFKKEQLVFLKNTFVDSGEKNEKASSIVNDTK